MTGSHNSHLFIIKGKITADNSCPEVNLLAGILKIFNLSL